MYIILSIRQSPVIGFQPPVSGTGFGCGLGLGLGRASITGGVCASPPPDLAAFRTEDTSRVWNLRLFLESVILRPVRLNRSLISVTEMFGRAWRIRATAPAT